MQLLLNTKQQIHGLVDSCINSFTDIHVDNGLHTNLCNYNTFSLKYNETMRNYSLFTESYMCTAACNMVSTRTLSQ